MDGTIAGFERRRLPGANVEIDALVGGSGPPLLLLHGFPQTRMAWATLAPILAERFTLVIPDLRGYGRSDKPRGDEAHTVYSKRTMARDQLRTMQALGYDRFAVAGHDRGARVAYRLALDSPQAVSRLAVLDIVPTAEMWANATAASAMRSYHWYFLAQPFPFPETMIGADPDFYLRRTLQSWAAEGFEFPAAGMADYLHCFRDPDSIHAACEDYRAGWTVDREADEADRGHNRIDAPLLVVWAEQYGVARAQPIETWRRWATDVQGTAVPGGHFVCEEAAAPTGEALLRFFS